MVRANLSRGLRRVVRAIGERGGTMLSALFPGGGPPAARDARALVTRYKDLPWLMAVAGRVSRATASQRWALYYKSGAAGKAVPDKKVTRMTTATRHKTLEQGMSSGAYVEVETHPLLDMLERGNDALSGKQVIELTTLYLDVVGECFWLIERGVLNVPFQIWPIPAHWMERTPTPDDPYYNVQIGSWREKIPLTEVVYFRNPNPSNPYGRGIGLAAALADELEADEHASKHINAWFKNRARPDLLVMGKIAPSDTKRLEREWVQEHRGFWNAFKPRFLSGTDFHVHELNQSFQSMQLVDLRKFGRDFVSQVWGVPLEIMNILENSNRSTIDVAEYIFMKNTIVPRLEVMREVLQRDVVLMFDERLILDYDNPVPEDLEFRLKVMEKAPWAFSQNEWRRFGGADEVPGTDGDVYLVQASLVPVRSLAELADAEEPAPGDEPPGDDEPPAPEPEPDEDDAADNEPPPAGGDKGLARGGVVTVRVADVINEHACFLPIPSGMRGRCQACDAPLAPEESCVVCGQAVCLMCQQDKTHCCPVEKDEDVPEIIVPQPALNAQDIEVIARGADPQVIHAKVRPALAKTIKDFGDAALQECGVNIAFDLADPRALKYLRSESAERVKNLINNTTRNRLRKTMTDGVNAGESMAKLQDRIVKVFGEARGHRSHNIARTETHRAANFGTYEGYRDAGIQKVQWLITMGGNNRDEHSPGRRLHNQVRPLNQAFENDAGQQAFYPGSFGDPGQDCQCQCRVIGYFGKSIPAAHQKALWSDFIARERGYIRAFRAALRKGFNEQEATVLRAFERVAGR